MLHRAVARNVMEWSVQRQRQTEREAGTVQRRAPHHQWNMNEAGRRGSEGRRQHVPIDIESAIMRRVGETTRRNG